MPDDPKINVVGESLDEALLKMQSLEARINRGDDIPEEELDQIARSVAHSVEDALDALKALVGPENQKEIEEEMISRMSDEEYQDWMENFPVRQLMRLEREQERLAKQNG